MKCQHLTAHTSADPRKGRAFLVPPGHEYHGQYFYVRRMGNRLHCCFDGCQCKMCGRWRDRREDLADLWPNQLAVRGQVRATFPWCPKKVPDLFRFMEASIFTFLWDEEEAASRPVPTSVQEQRETALDMAVCGVRAQLNI